MLPHYLRLATTNNTEAARASFLIAPLLAEVWWLADQRVALFTGVRFDVDEAAGLVGVCDYILGHPPQLHYVTAPIMMIEEANNEDIAGGLGQCAAAMVAAQKFNAARKSDSRCVFGAVTDGERWRFLQLTGSQLRIAMSDYSIADPNAILGVLLHIVGITPAAPAAA